MSLERIRILSILVISSAVSALLSGDFSWILFLLLVGATLPLFGPINLDRIRSHWFWRVYGLLTFATVGGLFYFRFPVQVSVFLLVLFSIIYELYGERRVTAPGRLIPLLSFLVVLYQARIESGLGLALGLWVFIFALVFCLYSFNSASLFAWDAKQLARKSFGPGFKLTLPILVIGFLCFWALPRLPGQNLKSIPSLGGSSLSGFSGEVSLNDIRSLKLSRKHVLDLKPLTPLPTRYLKGAVLDHYRAGFWTHTEYATSFALPEKGLVYYFRSTNNPKIFEYQIDQEAHLENRLFFCDSLLQLKGVPQPVRVSGFTDQISVLRNVPIALSYTLKSSIEPLALAPNVDLAIYLTLPENDYLQTLADSLTHVDDLPLQRVQKIMAWFYREFRYSLDVNTTGVSDPIKDFLLNTRKGHCELFASSLALLLRTQKVPTRLVTGFLLPELHPSGSFYYVTESDAHAWVEVLIDGKWTLIDPTPPSPPALPSFGEVPLAYLRHFWRANVMSWDYDRQHGVLEAGRSFVNGLDSAAIMDWLGRAVLSLAVLILLLRLGKARFAPRGPVLIRLYAKLDKRIQEVYGPRPAAIGIYPYLEGLPLTRELSENLRQFQDRYHLFRFSQSTSPEELTQLITTTRELLKRFKSIKSNEPQKERP